MGRPAAIVGVIVGGLSAAVAGSVLTLGVSRAAGEPRAGGAVRATARLEAEAKADCFTVRFFIKNEGDESTEIIYGHGRGGQELVPSIQIFGGGGRSVSITPPIYRYPPFRHMNPDTLRIPAREEVLYGTYTMGYPPEGRLGRDRMMIEAAFEYRERGRREPNLRVHTEPIPFPPLQAH
jgi:hypothetical protein